ncbi:RNA-directed DNA polymerase from transposon BS, partial [Paramuricea clavata]
SINYKSRNDLVPDGLEAVCLEICKRNSRNFIAAPVYRPPDALSALFDAFEKMH